MRVLVLSICACFTWPAFAATGLADCAGIESALERLDCYDRLAAKSSPPEQQTDESAAGASVIKLGRAEQRAPAERAPAEKVEIIDARIESVRKAPLGQHVMTLSNGQVWMENEPGRRSIAPDQAVTIRKHRWHFEMELASQPNVTVRRVD